MEATDECVPVQNKPWNPKVGDNALVRLVHEGSGEVEVVDERAELGLS